MITKDFTSKHDLCEYGLAQAGLQDDRDLQDVWHDEKLPIGGTILMWIASRAQYEKKELIRCCAELSKEVVKYTGQGAAAAESCIQTVLGWCDGKADREQVDAMVRDCLDRAKACTSRTGAEAERWAWSALSTLGRCIRSTSCCSGLASAITKTAVAAGEKAEATQQHLAQLVRQRISWNQVETTILANKTSPKPRKKTPDEVAAETKRIMEQFETLLRGLAEAQGQKKEAFASAGTTEMKIRGFLHSNKISGRTQSLINEKAAELEAADLASTESARPGAAPPRRPRMVV
jgi:hypothetical protein